MNVPLNHTSPDATATDPRPPTRGPGLFRLIVGTAMSAALALLIAVQLFQDRITARAHSEEVAVNLTGAIARDVTRHIDLFRFVLEALRKTVSSPEYQKVPENLRDTLLFAHTAVPQTAGVLLVTDENGVIQAASVGPDLRGQSRAWRSYFAYHRDHDDTSLLITGPLLSAINKEPVIVLSMRISDASGAFKGVVLSSMRLTYFDQLLKDLMLSKGTALTLFLDHGVVLARKPFDPLVIGRDLWQTANLQPAIGKAVTVYEDDNANEGERLVVATAVPGTSMLVTLSQPLSQIYGHWWSKVWTIGLPAILLIAGIIGLIVAVHREGHRRAKAQAELGEANALLERMATTDPLTGIANRRMFDELLRQEQAQARHVPPDAAILMIDIDLFKSFNDTYGHGAGDATLRSVALAITRAVAQGGNLAARVGGEEFAVLLTKTDMSCARAVAENIREAIASLGIRHSGSPHGHVTVSIGLASTALEPTPETFSAVMDCADEALYTAKKNGRDRVEVAALAMVAA